MKKIRLLGGLLIMAAVAGLTVAQHQHETSTRDRDRDRWMWQLPQQVMNAIGIKPGMVVADVGAGDGYFSCRLAERVGKTGRVLANDIDGQALSVLKERCHLDKIENITIIEGQPEDPRLPQAVVDLALLVNVIHLVERPTLFLENLKQSLKQGGVIVFVQWDADKMEVESLDWDPEDRARYSQQTTLEKVRAAGLDVIRTETFLPVQNIYICVPR